MTENKNVPSPEIKPSSSSASNQITQLTLKKEDIKDILHKELDLIQGIVTRMASNSFQCKSWLIGILTFVLTLGKESVFSLGWYGFVLLLPIFIFWLLDGFFLYMEQRYRDLYNFTVSKRTGKLSEAEPTYYNLNFTKFEHKSLIKAGMTKHFWVYLGGVFRNVKHDPKITVDEEIQPVKTVPGVMFSKTLLPFYMLPVLFVFFIALKGAGVVALPKPEKEKEAVTVRLDSTTLKPILQLIEKIQPPATNPTAAPASTAPTSPPNNNTGNQGQTPRNNVPEPTTDKSKTGNH